MEIRFLPDDMSSAHILYNGIHYPIRRTDRNENCRTKRDNPPYINYAKLGGGGINPNLYHREYICLSTVSVMEF